jgi:glutathione S-transferase
MLAFKGLGWAPVRMPAVMPKPDLVALTGGYRRAPVLQRGCHVYCDTYLISRVLERLAPTPSLFPRPECESVAEWADKSLFDAVVPIAMRPTRIEDVMRMLTPDELAKIADDRAAMSADAKRAPPSHRAAKDQLAVYLKRLEEQLFEAPYLLGKKPSIADFSAYHCLWFLELTAPQPLAGLHNVHAWLQRIRAWPCTQAAAVSPADALGICRNSPTNDGEELRVDPSSGFSTGDRVTIRAIDWGREPIEGRLVHATSDELAITRSDVRAGHVVVHFPRLGFEVRKRD